MSADLVRVLTQPAVIAALVAVGVLLLGIEVAVLPGFGFAGGLGVGALGAAAGLALIGAGSPAAAVERAAVGLGTALVLTAGAAALTRSFVRAGRPDRPGRLGGLDRGLVLRDRGGAGAEAPAASARTGALRGARGVAVTDLRPGGRIRLDGPGGVPADPAGAPVDVVTRGEYLPAGAAVEVVADEGYRRVVRLRPSRHPQLRPPTGLRPAPESAPAPAPEGSRTWKAS